MQACERQDQLALRGGSRSARRPERGSCPASLVSGTDVSDRLVATVSTSALGRKILLVFGSKVILGPYCLNELVVTRHHLFDYCFSSADVPGRCHHRTK